MLLTREQADHVRTLGWSPDNTYSVSITDVWISRDVQVSIGRQLKALCISFDLPYSMIRDRLVQELYWHETSGRLGLMIGVSDSNVESVYLQIPEGHWGFREEGAVSQ